MKEQDKCEKCGAKLTKADKFYDEAEELSSVRGIASLEEYAGYICPACGFVCKVH